MALQVKGNSGTNLEVETASRAARVTIRPIDYGSLGSYSHGAVSGTMTAGLGAGGLVYSFRWPDSTRIALIRRVAISAGNTATPFTAGQVIFQMFAARSWTAADTGGSDVTPTGNDCKRRTSMGNTLLTSGSIRISTTAALTAGTRTLDQQPLAAICSSVTAVAGTPLMTPGQGGDLWTYSPGDSRYPLYLTTQEGFIITATVPASGTWVFAVSVDWDELTSASYF